METLMAGSGRRVQLRWLVPALILVLLVAAMAGVVYLVSLPTSVFVIAVSTWFHVLATIVWIGYYLFTSLVYLPVLERRMKADELRELLEQLSARFRPFFGGSLLIFLVTGTHLMLVNQSYLGLGDFFGNPWSVLVVVKHVLVAAFLALAMFSERAFMVHISDRKPEALKRFRWASDANAVLGVIVLLLTAIAQAA